MFFGEDKSFPRLISFDLESEQGKKMMIVADLNELTYAKISISIDDKTFSGNVAFNLIQGCNSKGYVDGSAFMALEHFKNKIEPVSAPSLFNMEKQFRQ
jgi:hypothetical protein